MELSLLDKLTKLSIKDKDKGKEPVPILLIPEELVINSKEFIEMKLVPENENQKKNSIQKGTEYLNSFQKDVLRECIQRKSGGLSLPMGSGKTLLSIILGLQLKKTLNETEKTTPILVVCAKSLVASWQEEIRKFFGDSINYQVLHQDHTDLYIWNLDYSVDLIITTPDVLSKIYTEKSLDNVFVIRQFRNFVVENLYRPLPKPFLSHRFGTGTIYSVTWSCLIVDEAQNYTNITSKKCQAISAICAKYRWMLSGTMFNEPKPERILGYYTLLHLENTPRTIPDTKLFIANENFSGLQYTLVHRENNEAFTPPEVKYMIVEHELTLEEALIYTTFRDLIISINAQINYFKFHNNDGEHTEEIKRLSSRRLVILMYLRLSIICSLIPITSIILNAADLTRRQDFANMIIRSMRDNGTYHVLENSNHVLSSRLKSVISVITKHSGDRVVVFSNFASCIELLVHYFPDKNRKIFRIEAHMSINQRGKVIEDFSKSENGILLLTYQLGAEGLNLQCSSTVILVDFWWNAAKTQQAIARLVRYGQTSPSVQVYLFSSNTGIEEIIFKKQKAKLVILDELRFGCIKTSIPKIKITDIIRMLKINENKRLLEMVVESKT